jgi:hypothetical protein
MAREKSIRAEGQQKFEKVAFLTWFVSAVDRYPTLKPHHMSAVKAYFGASGLAEEETAEDYDKALKRYGI